MFNMKIISKVKKSIWLYPTMYSLLALILAIVITVVDRSYTNRLGEFLGSFFYTKTTLAQSVLGIVAGAFITIAIFTFSTTMVVLTMYSSQFTPRVVENFLNNDTTMKSFGIFLSGFIYSIISLLFINTSADDHLVIAASVGVIYVILGLVYFLRFIHNVSTYIQANGLILRLHNEALGKIKQHRRFVKDHQVIQENTIEGITKDMQILDILSPGDGYIQEIDYTHLKEIAQKHQCVVIFKKVVGQFVDVQTNVVTVYYQGKEPPDEKIVGRIQGCLTIGNKKTEAQDFIFTIQKIVEIALRALSPGINDPNTAIHCIKITGILLRDIADLEHGYVLVKDKDVAGMIILEAYDYKYILHDAYNQIILYGQQDSAVTQAIFKALSFAKGNATQENEKIINGYAVAIYEKIKNNDYDKLEDTRIHQEYKETIDYTRFDKSTKEKDE